MKRSPFNSCDYLCGRCGETDHCEIFALLRGKALSRQSEDAAGDRHGASIEDVKESLDETLEILKSITAVLNIEPDDRTDLRGLDRHSIDNDALYQLALTFTVKTYALLKAIEPFIRSADEAAFEDLIWYHRMVSVKTRRALASDYGGLSDDAVNSAEVAARSLTRCVEAFGRISESCPFAADDSRHLSHTALEIRRQLGKRFAKDAGQEDDGIE